MSARPPSGAHVCLRCASRLAVHNSRLLSTTSKRPQNRHEAADASPRPRGPKSTHTKGWTSFIKNKYLGKSASVLVLRDFETNRRAAFIPREDGVEDRVEDGVVDGANLQRQDVDDVNFEHLRASISAQKKAPGQEEVNASINGIRDRLRSTSPFAGTHAITRAAYNKIADELTDAFNQAQISRYISIYEGDRLLKEQKKTSRSKRRQQQQQQQRQSSHGKLRLSEWEELHTTATPANSNSNPNPNSNSKSKSKVLRGKKGLVDALIRSAWRLEVVEEIEAAGVLTLSLTHPQHLTWLLHGEADSHLSTIGRSTNCELQVRPSENKLNVTGPKYQCLRAATEIDRLLNELVELQIDLKPLPKDEQSVAKIHEVFQKSKCLIDWDETKRKATVLAGSQAEAQHLQRSLVNATNTSGLPEQLLLNGSPSEGGYLWPSTPFTRSRMLIFSPPSKGRFADSVEFGNASNHPPQPVSQEVAQSIWSHLNGPASSKPEWSSDVTSIIKAEPGVILHSTNGHGLHYLSSSNLLSSNSHDFRSLSVGLPQLLALGGRTATSTTTNTIRIRFVPSPWAPKPASPSASKPRRSHRLPALEMDLALDETSRHVHIDRLSALTTHRAASVHLPALATDARFVRTDQLRLRDPHAAPSIAAFVAHVAASAAGFGRVSPPTSLAVPLPPALLPPGQLLAEYFTAELEFVQSLAFPLPSDDAHVQLVVTSRSSAAAAGTGSGRARESAAVVMRRRHPLLASDSKQEVDVDADAEEQGFMRAANAVLRAVNRFAGDQRVLEREPRVQEFDAGLESASASASAVFRLPTAVD